MPRKQIKDFDEVLRRELERVSAAPISQKDRRAIRRFAHDMLSRGNKPSYVYSEISRLRVLRRRLGKDFGKVTEPDLRRLFLEMDRQYSPKSMLSYKKLARLFWTWLRPAKPTVDNPYRLPKEVLWIAVMSRFPWKKR